MPNMKAQSLTVRKLYPMFKSRSNVTVKVTHSKCMVLLEGLIIRNKYAKYESPTS